MCLKIFPFPHRKDLVVSVVTGGMHRGWNSKTLVRAVVRLERVRHRFHPQPVGDWSQSLGRKPLARARHLQ